MRPNAMRVDKTPCARCSSRDQRSSDAPPSNGALVLEPHGGPLMFWNQRPGKPAHVHAEVVQPPQIHIGRDGTCAQDRKSTRLNSSHGYISYAVFCLKKNKNDSYD